MRVRRPLVYFPKRLGQNYLHGLTRAEKQQKYRSHFYLKRFKTKMFHFVGKRQRKQNL